MYVDDLLVTGDHDLCRWVIDKLAQRFAVKETGNISPFKPGKVKHLGREICREKPNGFLSIGMPKTYFDSVETALGMELKPVAGPPRLEKDAKISIQKMIRLWMIERLRSFDRRWEGWHGSV